FQAEDGIRDPLVTGVQTCALPISRSGPTLPRRRARGIRSALVVLIMVAPPETRLVAAPGGAVEPLVHAPETVQSARIGGVAVVRSEERRVGKAGRAGVGRVRAR